MELIEITRLGEPAIALAELPKIAKDIGQQTAKLYERAGSFPPWVGYFALEEKIVVGTCAFHSPPRGGEVEIAYHTFPGFEGRGLATGMVRRLIKIATERGARVFAFTLPEENASNRILRKLGFAFSGERRDEDDRLVWRWEQTSGDPIISAQN